MKRQVDRRIGGGRVEEGMRWVDARELGVEGRGFADTEDFYDRFPGRARGRVPGAVWDLSRNSAGMCVRFVTDAASVSVRWRVRSEKLAMEHMAATGVSGVDVYMRHEGRWRWLGVGMPVKFPENELSLTLAVGRREMMLYLPLYNGVEEVLVGAPEEAVIERAPAWERQRARSICFYGSSIVQGGCASRPGMSYAAIISRRLDWPHYNFGFSGNGRSEREVAELLGELDVAAYVLDALPNMTLEQVKERMGVFVEVLRAARGGPPAAPIALVENIVYQDGYAVQSARGAPVEKNAALRMVYEELLNKGVEGLHYVAEAGLLGDDGEGTVDGVHPTDLGFMRMAEKIGGVLGEVLGVADGF